MRDPLAWNTDPTDEELDELIKSAFSPEKLGLCKLTEEQRQHMYKVVECAQKILGDTHLERLRQAVSDAVADIKNDADNYFVDNAIEDDVLLRESKSPRQKQGLADVKAGHKTQKDLILFSEEFARKCKFEYKP